MGNRPNWQKSSRGNSLLRIIIIIIIKILIIGVAKKFLEVGAKKLSSFVDN